MNQITSAFLLIVLLSCTGKNGDAPAKAFETFQKHNSNDEIEAKLLRKFDSLKAIYGDSLIYVSDIYNAFDTSGQEERNIVDTIASLKEVKDRAEYVRKQTDGGRHLRYTIWQRPTTKQPYYWVKVLEDNGTSSHTHFNFYVRPKPFQVFYYDAVNDTLLDLAAWRKEVL